MSFNLLPSEHSYLWVKSVFVCEWICVCTSSLDFHLLRLSFPSTRYSSFVSLTSEHFRRTWPPSSAQDRYFSPPAHLTSFPIHFLSLICSVSPLFLSMPLLKCQVVCISVALCPVIAWRLWSSTHTFALPWACNAFSPLSFCLLKFREDIFFFGKHTLNVHWNPTANMWSCFPGCFVLFCTHTVVVYLRVQSLALFICFPLTLTKKLPMSFFTSQTSEVVQLFKIIFKKIF